MLPSKAETLHIVWNRRFIGDESLARPSTSIVSMAFAVKGGYGMQASSTDALFTAASSRPISLPRSSAATR